MIKYIFAVGLNLLYKIKWFILKNLFHYRKIWEFENGIKFYQDQLLHSQIQRYKKVNLHEPEEGILFEKILKKYNGTGAFIDIGAAGGYYTILAKKHHQDMKVYPINPSDKFIKMFDENIELNNIGKIKQYKSAISNYEGMCSIANGWGSAISQNGDITVTTLSKYINKINTKVFLIKMDIQGEEVKALEKAQDVFSQIGNWIIGTHGETEHEQCLELLSNGKYKIDYEEINIDHQPDGIILASQKS